MTINKEYLELLFSRMTHNSSQGVTIGDIHRLVYAIPHSLFNEKQYPTGTGINLRVVSGGVR